MPPIIAFTPNKSKEQPIQPPIILLQQPQSSAGIFMFVILFIIAVLMVANLWLGRLDKQASSAQVAGISAQVAGVSAQVAGMSAELALLAGLPAQVAGLSAQLDGLAQAARPGQS
ncbi:hypothetical protein PtA15_18A122 [Puccinia triticina]|uniref:Methyl-accepting chemotaxis protein n=1 Tax=Puccinia triticina TaxID=208348 RepID=A0ABY7D5X8_9BASI|nr:uncharacterized protein PtA15_18A122 [Puccinia triticina]WAQ93066.1 hypothetical protein PtA15_18A122 [Puccinia triticina]